MSIISHLISNESQNHPVPSGLPFSEFEEYEDDIVLVADTMSVNYVEQFMQLEVEVDENGYEWYRICWAMPNNEWLPMDLTWMPFEQAWEQYELYAIDLLDYTNQ